MRLRGSMGSDSSMRSMGAGGAAAAAGREAAADLGGGLCGDGPCLGGFLHPEHLVGQVRVEVWERVCGFG